MVMYINLHMALEQMRQKAEHSESDIGPRVSDYSVFLVVKCIYNTLYSLSFFSLTKRSAKLTIIRRLREHCMISNNNINLGSLQGVCYFLQNNV